MTVEVQTPYNEHTGNGVSTTFGYTFQLLDAADLVVYVDGVEQDAGDYTVSGVGDAGGGDVEFDTAPANDAVVLLSRELPLERSTDYQVNGDLPSAVLDRDFDRLWQVIQQLGAIASSALRVPYPESPDAFPAAADRLDLLPAFDASTGQTVLTTFTATQLASTIAAAYTGAAGPLDAMSFLQSGGSAVSRTAQDKARDFITVADFDATGDGTDESTKIQAAATAAKAAKKALRFTGSTGTVYRCNNVDVAGLDVYCDAGVSLTAPAAATGYALIAIGTALSRVTTPTRLYNFVHTGGGTQLGFFKAEYCDDPYVINCFGSGYPMTALQDGQGIRLIECNRPLVLGGKYEDGRLGVIFASCTGPVAMGVHTENQGRDGIAFYTEPTGTTTTDALATMCITNDFAINGEAGRAGLHFYGVRRCAAVGCIASNDNSQTQDDTGGLRFRDCEDFAASGYSVSNTRAGVLVNEVGDFAGAPHNIVVRGAIGAGSVDNVRKYGIFVTGSSTAEVSITGAKVSNVADVALAAGIVHSGIGSVSGCTLSDMACTGIYTTGEVSVSGNTLARCGKGSTSIPAIWVPGGTALVGGNHIFDDRGGSATSTLAIRVGGTATIGVNSYGAGITDFVTSNIGSTIRRDSVPIRQKFSGVPGSLAGTIENGVRAIDTSGVMYEYVASAWRRAQPRALGSTAIAVVQTTVAHGLGYAPTCVTLTPLADARVWESAAPDTTNVYLTASSAINVKINVQ